MDNNIEQLMQQAVKIAYTNWAQLHPSLAAAIDRVEIYERTAVSLRESEEFKQAVSGYTQAAAESNILSKLINLTETIIPMIL